MHVSDVFEIVSNVLDAGENQYPRILIMWSGIPCLDAAEAAKMQKEFPDLVKLVEKPETCGH